MSLAIGTAALMPGRFLYVTSGTVSLPRTSSFPCAVHHDRCDTSDYDTEKWTVGNNQPD